MAKKRNELSHYPRFFFSKLLFNVVSWTIFSTLFIFLGKKYADKDILGEIYRSIFGKEKNFNQYFLGAGKIAEKNKALNYAVFFLTVIVVLNVIALLLNKYLWEKDKYIKNNNFYLHNKWIFIINTLTHVASACLLTASFVSIFIVILALLFITFNSWELFPRKKEAKNPQTESFFSWKNQYVRKILIYSTIIIFVVPLIIGRLQAFHNNALEGSPEGFAKAYQTLVNSSSAVKGIMELITQTNYSLFHWFILLWFVKNIISGRWKEFADFWTQVNSAHKKSNDFRHYYYYQEGWALTNNKTINLGDYEYLKNNPKFLGKEYLEGNLDIDDFSKQNKKVVKYIEFCEDKIKEPPKRNFLNYCLFNEFNSWEDCLRTKRLIRTTRKK